MKIRLLPTPMFRLVLILSAALLAAAAPVLAGWSIETVATESPVVLTSIETDSRGRCHVVFRNESTGEIRYLVRNAPATWSDWSFPYHGSYPDLSLDRVTGEAFVAYRATSGDLVLAWRDDQGDWQSTPLTTGEQVSAISIVAADGEIHVSYTNTLDQLRYRYHDTTPGSFPFGALTIDTAASSPIETSIALRSDGLPRIAYYLDGTLRYARATNPSDLAVWSTALVDDSADVGQYCSLALTDTNSPVIAYYDATTNDLKLATQSLLLQWQTVVVDGVSYDDGRGAALHLDPSSQLPRVAYWRQNGPYGLRFAARRAGGTWYLEDVSSNSTSAVSLALDSMGNTRIAFYDSTIDIVRMAAIEISVFADGFESGNTSAWSSAVP